MRIDVDKIPKEGLKISRDFDFPSLELIEEAVVFLEPVHADVAVRAIGEEIRVKGRITARLSFVCSRCLTPFEFPVDSRFDLVFLPEEVHELKDELGEEDLDQLFYADQADRLPGGDPRTTEPDVPAQAPLLGGLRGDLRGLRPGPARQPLRLPGPGARRPAEPAQKSIERQEIKIMPNPKRRHSHSRKEPAAGPRFPGGAVVLRLLQLRDPQASPPGLPGMRFLQGPPGHQASRRIDPEGSVENRR